MAKPFNRAEYEAQLRVKHSEATAHMVIGAYSPVAFSVALQQMQCDPMGLTDEDIQMLALVDADLGSEAHIRRAGFVKPESETAQQINRLVVTGKILLNFYKQHIGPYVASIRYRVREAHLRLDRIEARFPDPRTASAADMPSKDMIKSLVDRIQTLEQKPVLEYFGVFHDGMSYRKGAAVTFDGCVWIAEEATSARPGDSSTPSRAWRLAVKSGRNGRDGKDARP